MGSFNNTGISGLWIGGKSVRRASLGGKVFFEKHDYDLSLTSDKSILSHADNESATLTATLTDYNEPVSGETVIFSSDVAFKSTVVSESGTYDFGNCFVIDCSSLSSTEDELSLNKNGMYIKISRRDSGRIGIIVMNSSTSIMQLGRTDGIFTIENGFIKGHGVDGYSDFSWDISNVDLTDWTLSSGVSVTVDEYWWASDVTDSNGEATVGYVSKGAGDLNIKVECMNLQETYVLSDCYYYDSLTIDKGRYITVSGSPVLTYSSNGLNINTSVASIGLVKNNFLTLPSDYEAEITVIYAPQSSYCGGICFDDWLWDWGSRSANGAGTFKLSNTTSLHLNLQKPVTNDVINIIKTGTTIKAYINNNLIVTDTISGDNHLQQFRTYQNRSTTFKNLKIKAL